MATEIISGPEILLRDDEQAGCRLCALELPRTQEDLIAHYVSLHKYQVTADYTYKGVRYVELDKEGKRSDRAKRLKNRGLLAGPHLSIEKLRDDFANDSAILRVTVENDPNYVFQVRISASAQTMAGSEVANRIRKWYLNNPLPAHGSCVAIPEYHFDPRYI